MSERLQKESFQESDGDKVVNGVTVVFVANIAAALLNGVLSFLLPKYLSVESYGYLKTFQLWLSYFGILSFGYMDGVYLKYGGASLQQLDGDELARCHSSFRGYHVILTICIIVLGLILNSSIVMLLGVIVLPYNMSNYFRTFYQAVGEFKKYGKVLAIIPVITLVLDLIALFIFKTDNYLVYIFIIMATNIIVYFYLEYINGISRQNSISLLFKVDYRHYISIAKEGIILNLSNFFSTLLTSIDRWFIKALLSLACFSYYSFAVTIETMFNVCVSPVTVTLYNYFCKNDNARNSKKVSKVMDACVLIAIYLISVAFPCKFIIQRFIVKYNQSINIVFILLASHVFYFVIKSVFVNIQKATGKQNVYFYNMIIILATSIVTNTGAYLLTHSMIGFAYATLITSIIWMIICTASCGREFINVRGLLIQFGSVVLFLIIGFTQSPIIGFIIYITCVTLLAITFMRETFTWLIAMIISTINKKILRRTM